MVQLLSGVIKGKAFWRGSHYNGPAQGGCRGGLVHHYVCHRLCLLVGHVSLSYIPLIKCLNAMVTSPQNFPGWVSLSPHMRLSSLLVDPLTIV